MELVRRKAVRELGASPTALTAATRVAYVERTLIPTTGTEYLPEVPKNLCKMLVEKQVVVKVDRGISGTGLFSGSSISRHALLIEIQGERIYRTEMERCEQLYIKRGSVDEYILEIRDCGVVPDPTVYGNRARFANHGCEPNAGFYTVRVSQYTLRVVFVYAVDDIDSGADKTVDYNWPAEAATLPVFCNYLNPPRSLLIALR